MIHIIWPPEPQPPLREMDASPAMIPESASGHTTGIVAVPFINNKVIIATTIYHQRTELFIRWGGHGARVSWVWWGPVLAIVLLLLRWLEPPELRRGRQVCLILMKIIELFELFFILVYGINNLIGVVKCKSNLTDWWWVNGLWVSRKMLGVSWIAI